MIIVYAFKAGCSKHRDVELKWSLRSVAKYAVGRLPEIVICGDRPPDFVDLDAVTWLEHGNSCRSKHENMLAHVFHAIDSGLDKPFLLSSDDHFFIRQADFDRYPTWSTGGKLPTEQIARGEDGNGPVSGYTRSLIDTRNILEERGFEAYRLNGHFNTWIDPADLPVVENMISREPGARYGYEPSALFGNARLERLGTLDLSLRGDVKICEFDDEADLVRQAYAGKDSFSISDDAFANPMFERIMNRWYNERSPYEQD